MKYRLVIALLTLSFVAVACSEAGNDNLVVSRLGPGYRYIPNPTIRCSESCASDTIKLLFIGNSFARDVSDTYLRNMLDAEDVNYVIGRLHLSSCSISMHLDNAIDNNGVYEYAAWDNDNELCRRNDMTISEALESEYWTHVSFQQVSKCSGKTETYGSYLDNLMLYVKDRVCYDTKFVFFQTWAYGPTYSGDAFKVYDYSQSLMYSSIVLASRYVFDGFPFDILVPVGTAIQNGRTSTLGNDLTRDGIHLSDIGQFVACAAWCEALTGSDVRGNTYNARSLTPDQCRLAREVAHRAIISPYSISTISE